MPTDAEALTSPTLLKRLGSPLGGARAAPSNRYAVAVLAVGLSLTLKILFSDYLGYEVPFLLLFGAVTLSAWYGGTGPALLASALSSGAAWYLFLPAYSSFALRGNSAVQLGAFVAECGAIVALSVSAQRSRLRAERLASELFDAQEARVSSEARLALLVEGVREYSIVMLEPDGTIASWNSGAERLSKYTADEVVGRSFALFHTDEDRLHGVPQRELEMARERGRHKDEGWRVRKDGTKFWADILMSAIRDDKGTLVGFGKVTRDMTEQRRAESALRRAKEELEHRVRERTAALEATNKELEAFSYSVSHDLRAPLRGVDGFANILMSKYGASFDEKGRHYLERIRAGTQRMASLIDDLLRLSRLTRAELRHSSVDLAALARDVVEDLRRSQPERIVTVDIPERLQVVGDPNLLRIVLENLIGNAWKFTRTTANARIELGTAGVEDERRVFYVRDNGAGFEMEYVDKLFAPFQRLHDPAEFEGTGIGLATVQRIIIRHGGRVRAEGRPRGGATFFFSLPEGPLR